MPAEDAPATLGTAGHIDHGKTALVAALTGVDTDRLPQEKRRGISIELGYAPLLLPSGRRLSMVDVPGHERFVRTMVSGATGIDLYLLAVACDDGVMPQTREHVAILRMLGVTRGVVALTKRDLVDAGRAAEVRSEVAELVPGAPAVEVAAPAATGLDQLRGQLDRAAAQLGGRPAADRVRLPIDRAFTLHGIGTVVTGTLWSGTVAAGDRLIAEPGGQPVRVRSVQVHDAPVAAAGAGQRVAVALTGVERSQLGRGQTLLTPGWLTPSYRLDCRIEVLADAPHALRNGERITVHHATAELPGRMAVPGGGEIPAGAAADVQLRMAGTAVAAAGDRVILRLTAPRVTVAGGAVLDPAPTRTRRPALAVPAEAPAAPRAGPSPAGADELLARIAAGGLQPPGLGAEDQEAAAHLAATGQVVRAGRDLAFATGAFTAARDTALRLALAEGSVTIAGLRDRLGISRRYAQALLEAMDAQGLTRRQGDLRVLRRHGRELAAGL